MPISYLLYLFINRANKKIITTSIISFGLFAIPGILLILTWGDIYDTKNLSNPNVYYGAWIHPKYILKSFPIVLSFFGFYMLPIMAIEFFNTKFKSFFNQYYKSFFISLIFLFLLSQINLLDYLGNFKMGGGAILKVNYLIQKNNFFLLLVFSSIGFSVLVRFFLENFKNNAAILLPLLIIYSSRNPFLVYQEYYEPLILILFFLILETNLRKIYFKNISLSHIIFVSYFVVYLIGAIYFKHFAFDSFEKWQIFLNTQ